MLIIPVSSAANSAILACSRLVVGVLAGFTLLPRRGQPRPLPRLALRWGLALQQLSSPRLIPIRRCNDRNERSAMANAIHNRQSR